MIKFFDGLDWVQVKAVYIYHEGIGFVTMSSIRCFANGEWHIVSAGNRQLIGANQ